MTRRPPLTEPADVDPDDDESNVPPAISALLDQVEADAIEAIADDSYSEDDRNLVMGAVRATLNSVRQGLRIAATHPIELAPLPAAGVAAPETIARALATSPPPFDSEPGCCACCGATAPIGWPDDPAAEFGPSWHEPECPWAMASRWAAGHPAPGSEPDRMEGALRAVAHATESAPMIGCRGYGSGGWFAAVSVGQEHVEVDASSPVVAAEALRSKVRDHLLKEAHLAEVRRRRLAGALAEIEP